MNKGWPRALWLMPLMLVACGGSGGPGWAGDTQVAGSLVDPPPLLEPHGAVPWIGQLDGLPNQYMNCGPATIAMAARGYHRLQELRDVDLVGDLAAARGDAVNANGGTPPQGMLNMVGLLGLRGFDNPDSSDTRLASQLSDGFLVALAGDFYALPTHYDPSRTAGHWVLLTATPSNGGTFQVMDPMDPQGVARLWSRAQLQAFIWGNDGTARWAASIRID